jgi:hypothetical protein
VKSRTNSAEAASGFLVAGLVVMIAGTIFYLTNLSKPQPPIVVTAPPKLDPIPDPVPTIATSPLPTIAPTTSPEQPTIFSQNLPLTLGQESIKEDKLKAKHQVNYILTAKEGQNLAVEVMGDGMVMRVLAPNKEPIDAKANQVTTWEGKLPFTGDYQVPLKPNDSKPESDYKLRLRVSEDTPAIVNIVPIPVPSPSPSLIPSLDPSSNPSPP